MSAPYLILSLPRSRTFWLSRLLRCEHDPSRFFQDKAGAVAYLNEGKSCVDTALGLIWHEIGAAIRPDLRIAVIHRAVPDVTASLARIGVTPPHEMLRVAADRLLHVTGMHFAYSALATYEGAARLAYHCTGVILDPFRWDEMENEPLECDFAAYQRDMMANARGIAALYAGEWVR